NMGLWNIENNINEHYQILDQNIEKTYTDNSKNRLIDIISNNKMLKKRLNKQETLMRDKFTKNDTQNSYSSSKMVTPGKYGSTLSILPFKLNTISNYKINLNEFSDDEKEDEV